jgi:Icc-related predicted phosphoesterase
MKICCISDTHRAHREVEVPPVDMVIHAGDIGLEDYNGFALLNDFIDWFNNLPAKHKIFISGNHDWLSYLNKQMLFDLAKENGLIYLQDSSVTIEGLKFYGSPWSLEFNNWAWNLRRDETIATACWNQIPEDTDVLITHEPPYNILDYVVRGDSVITPPLGDCWLLDRIEQIKPKLHVFGHIHFCGRQTLKIQDTLFVNASICNEVYETINPPIVVEI